MPTLNLRVAPLQNPERYRALAAALTDITARTLDKRAEVTAVTIEDLPTARWTVGGRDVQRPTALLEISVTTGTNSAAQKAAFIAQAHAELQRQLAPGAALEEASYVIVREVPATDWGYAGETQAARQRARQQAQALRPEPQSQAA
ncbi:MAG: tautomerase family protein [Ramlibacter sp.]|nr:tautomerase family protein [Ramlibacter sp.]